MTIADNVVTLNWNPSVGLATKGANDTIRTVTYSSTSLQLISLQPAMHPELRATLSQLMNSVLLGGSITCTAP
jgi:hypothetical protein